MSRPRLPALRVVVDGADIKNPKRFKRRRAPKAQRPLGKPSRHLDLFAYRAFERFRRELPWLKESHRALVDLAATLRGRLLDPTVPIDLKVMQELRRCLGQLGATPADETRLNLTPEDEPDPEEALFH